MRKRKSLMEARAAHWGKTLGISTKGTQTMADQKTDTTNAQASGAPATGTAPAADAPKRGAKPAPANETKGDKFKRIGTPRINNAVRAISLLESMANKSQYDYTDDQRRVIETALDSAVQRVKDAFAGKAVAAGGVSL